MEEPQPTPEKPQGKLVPDPNTDFGNEAFDTTAMSQSRFSLSGINETIFGLMRPKKKVFGQKERGFVSRLLFPEPPKKYMGPPFHPDNRPTMKMGGIPYEAETPVVFNPHNNLDEPVTVPAGYTIENGLIVREKTLAEKVTKEDLGKGSIYPPLQDVRKVSLAIAEAVARVAYREGLAVHPEPEDLRAYLQSQMYEPVYESYAP